MKFIPLKDRFKEKDLISLNNEGFLPKYGFSLLERFLPEQKSKILVPKRNLKENSDSNFS